MCKIGCAFELLPHNQLARAACVNIYFAFGNCPYMVLVRVSNGNWFLSPWSPGGSFMVQKMAITSLSPSFKG